MCSPLLTRNGCEPNCHRATTRLPWARGHGLGRELAAAALGLLPADTPIFAQVSPGNSHSMRATLAAGYRPIGGEVLLPGRD